MPHDELDDLIKALHEIQVKLAKEIERSRRLRESMGLNEDELKAGGNRMASLLARMRIKRTVH